MGGVPQRGDGQPDREPGRNRGQRHLVRSAVPGEHDGGCEDGLSMMSSSGFRPRSTTEAARQALWPCLRRGGGGGGGGGGGLITLRRKRRIRLPTRRTVFVLLSSLYVLFTFFLRE